MICWQDLFVFFFISQIEGKQSTVPILSNEIMRLIFEAIPICWECRKIHIPFSVMFPGPTPWLYANPQEVEDLDLIYNYFEIKATILDRKLTACCQFPVDPEFPHIRIDLCRLVHNTPHTAAGYIMEAVLKENNLPEWRGWGKTIANIKELARHAEYIDGVPGEENQSTNILRFLRCHIGGADA